MKLLFIADQSIFVVTSRVHSWDLLEHQHDYEFHSIAADPGKQGRLYVGTFDNGLLVSDDYGETLHPVGEGITHDRVLSVAVSETEKVNDYYVVWAGTEPSNLFRSEDGGKTWTECPALLDLPSRSTWSFPPRPYTHHVRSIQPDLHDKSRVFAGIELGGVMRSEDSGETWEDRKEGSQFDCHTLTMNSLAEGRIYEAAGGGFAESVDGGATWETFNDGLDDYTYLVDVVVDPKDPDTIVASAAKSARTAYVPSRAHTVIVRKEKDQEWEVVHEGLPHPDGSSILSLTTHDQEPHVFYAVNNLGLYQSNDAGRSWNQLIAEWPETLENKRIRRLIVT